MNTSAYEVVGVLAAMSLSTGLFAYRRGELRAALTVVPKLLFLIGAAQIALTGLSNLLPRVLETTGVVWKVALAITIVSLVDIVTSPLRVALRVAVQAVVMAAVVAVIIAPSWGGARLAAQMLLAAGAVAAWAASVVVVIQYDWPELWCRCVQKYPRLRRWQCVGREGTFPRDAGPAKER